MSDQSCKEQARIVHAKHGTSVEKFTRLTQLLRVSSNGELTEWYMLQYLINNQRKPTKEMHLLSRSQYKIMLPFRNEQNVSSVMVVWKVAKQPSKQVQLSILPCCRQTCNAIATPNRELNGWKECKIKAFTTIWIIATLHPPQLLWWGKPK